MPAQASESGVLPITADAEQYGPPIAYTIKGAARALNVSRTWLYERIREGHLVSHRRAGRRLILHSDLIDFVRDGGDDA